jgi:two-component system, NtrC family, response regulator GlrR
VAAVREAKTVTVERGPSRPPLGAVVRVLNARSSPRELRVVSGTCRIGAGRDADLIIDDETVSRLHVELGLVPEGVEVRDLGSRNGSFYLGQRVEKMVLSLGSRLKLGHVEIAIDPDVETLAGTGAYGPTQYANLVGASAEMRRLFSVLTRLEGSLVTVLIEGESGTGKELVARALHDQSALAEGPFIAVNCGAMDRSLARSELFGHKRGAFTGAVEAAVGAFEAASGGSLFLDEIGDLPLDVQPALLRVLETGAITRVGETAERPVKVRVIAATHRDLEEEVKVGRFREDLFYRLAVVRLQIAPLRQRPEDIAELARHFAASAGGPELPDEAVAALVQKPWPGNVRELKNAVLAFLAIGTLPTVASPELGELEALLRRVIDVTRPYAEQKENVVQCFVRTYVEMLLAHTGGNQSEAARISGLERSHLRKLMGR